MKHELSIGIIGAGNFAAFAAKAFLEIEGIAIHAIFDTNQETGKKLADELGARFYHHYRELLNDVRVDLVYVATPPFLHFEFSKQALLAGKHVICEKPAALTAREAKELRALGKKQKLLYVVNLMQRYNPLYEIIADIIGQKFLGNFLHGFFENYASDENLGENHWFWDDRKSGGIFIEHGVHFFDMFQGWLGEGKVISAAAVHRPCVPRKIYDRVQATVLYQSGTVNFYHGFDQPKILDRQELRLLFERGEITLFGWIPTKMRLHGLFKTAVLTRVQKLISSSLQIENIEVIEMNGTAKGRFVNLVFDHEVTIDCQSVDGKENLYQQMLADMLRDQWSWIINNNHARTVDDRNAVESVKMAEQAKKIVQKL